MARDLYPGSQQDYVVRQKTVLIKSKFIIITNPRVIQELQLRQVFMACRILARPSVNTNSCLRESQTGHFTRRISVRVQLCLSCRHLTSLTSVSVRVQLCLGCRELHSQVCSVWQIWELECQTNNSGPFIVPIHWEFPPKFPSLIVMTQQYLHCIIHFQASSNGIIHNQVKYESYPSVLDGELILIRQGRALARNDESYPSVLDSELILIRQGRALDRNDES